MCSVPCATNGAALQNQLIYILAGEIWLTIKAVAANFDFVSFIHDFCQCNV
jgi:hypothetical protein